jgi:hypothetical protein
VPTGIRFQAFEFVDRSALSKADYWIKSVNFPGFLAPDGNFWAETGFDLDLRKPEWHTTEGTPAMPPSMARLAPANKFAGL